MADVALLSRQPRRFGDRVGIGATFDDREDVGAEQSAYLATRSCRADVLRGIFYRVVQEGGDRLILARSILKRYRRNRKQVGKIRDRRPFTNLAAVNALRECQRRREAGAQDWSRRGMVGNSHNSLHLERALLRTGSDVGFTTPPPICRFDDFEPR